MTSTIKKLQKLAEADDLGMCSEEPINLLLNNAFPFTKERGRQQTTWMMEAQKNMKECSLSMEDAKWCLKIKKTNFA